MLVCGPFHSVVNPPVGMAYLSSFLEHKDVTCKTLDLNIKSRSFLYETTGNKELLDKLYSQSCRTYLAEALAWSWHDPDGPNGILKRIRNHPSRLVREFWDGEGIDRLTSDPAVSGASDALSRWLKDRAKEIASLSPPWVGFSTTITNLASNTYLARCLKEIEPETIIIFGGPEITRRNAFEILSSFLYVDAAIPPPAYVPLYDLVSDLDSFRAGRPIKGIWRRDPHGTVQSDDTWRMMDLEELPPANWRGFNMASYVPGFILSNPQDIARCYPVIPLHTSQGCSYNLCDFCYNVSLYPHFSTQSPKRVIEEIACQLKRNGSRGFFFTDFEFNANPDRVKTICQMIRELDDGVRFYAWLRLDKTDRELLRSIYDGGARQIFIGVESVDDEVLQLMHKGYSSKLVIEKLRMLYEFWQEFPEFHYEFNLISQYPQESLHSTKNTLAQIAKNLPLFYRRVAAVVDFMLHEGTSAYRRLAPTAVGCTDVLFPPGARLRSYRYLFPESNEADSGEKRETWSAIRSLVQRDSQ